jgi:hypothetical protein
MGSTTTHGAPFPVGTDRVMDGDNAIQALAEWVDTTVYGGAPASAAAPGVWLVATGTVVCTSASLSAVSGSSVSTARYMKIGRTVWFQGEGNVGPAAVAGPAISLPVALAGAPYRRAMLFGQFTFTGTGQSASQTHNATMLPDLARFVQTGATNAYIDAPANTGVRWNVMYETTT